MKDLSRQELFGELRAVCQRPLDNDAWDTLVRVIDLWPDMDSLEHELLPYASNHLKDTDFVYQEDLLEAPPHWVDALLEGARAPYLALARGILIPSAQLTRAHAWQKIAPKIAHMQRLSIKHDDGDEPYLSKLDLSIFNALRILELQWYELGAAGARYLTQMDGLQNLHTLDLCGAKFGAPGLHLLGQAPWLSNLEALSLEWCKLEVDGMEELRNIGGLDKLEMLALEYNEIGNEGAAALADCVMPSLKHLDINLDSIADAGLAALAESSLLEHLTYLDLGYNHWGDEGLIALSKSPYLRRLETLLIASNDATDDGYLALANSPIIEDLTRLDVAFSKNVDANTWSELFSRDALSKLEKIEIDECAIGDRGCAQIFETMSSSLIEEFDTRENGIGLQAIAALAARSDLTRLRDLYIKDNPLGDEGFQLLARAPWMRTIEDLHIQHTGLGQSGIEDLVEHASDTNLKRLRMGNDPVSEMGWHALARWQALSKIEAIDIIEPRDLTPEALEAILLASRETLNDLELSQMPFTREHFGVLLDADLTKLHSLTLSACELESDDIEYLARSPLAPRLTSLNLKGSAINATARDALDSVLPRCVRGKWYSTD